MANKQLWLLTGGNGAGKTTFYQQFLAPKGVLFINADLIAAELGSGKSHTLAYKAARLAERLRFDLLRSGASFCFETVFSHPSKIDFMAEAKALGYEVILVFIHLQTAELNQARVVQRVSEGGHDVPQDKIISRIPRTLKNIHQALPLADKVRVYDNSSALLPFQTVVRLDGGQLIWSVDPLPDWAIGLLGMQK